jgi:phage tail sheath gpL-like
MTAANVLNITVVGSDKSPAASLADKIMKAPDHGREGIMALVRYLESIAGGSVDAKVFVSLAGSNTGTAGTGTIVCTRANAAGDSVTIGTTVFTEATSPSLDPKLGQFARGASDTTCGDNLAAAINAHPDFRGVLTAADVAGTITLTFADKGLHANQLTMSTTDATAFALTAPTNGAKGTLSNALRCYRRGL